MKHTPGPWRVDPRYPNDIQSLNGEFEIACTCSDVLTGGTKPSRGEQRANARLIAAAPDLLEAGMALVAEIVLNDDEGLAQHSDAIAAMRAAIAKATGEGE